MSAREMFGKLGYKIFEENDYKIKYYNQYTTKDMIYIPSIKCEQNNGLLPKTITFWKELKCIDFECGRKGSYLYLELLQAINKQFEEVNEDEERNN